jgi:hypothetical protein
MWRRASDRLRTSSFEMHWRGQRKLVAVCHVRTGHMSPPTLVDTVVAADDVMSAGNKLE